MRTASLLFLVASVMAATPLAAQDRTTSGGRDDARERATRSNPGGQADRRNPGDGGPHTPEANEADRGGGVILEGPPGAPAPAPQPTPPLPRSEQPAR